MDGRDPTLILFLADVVIGVGWVGFSSVIEASMIIKARDKLLLMKRASAVCAVGFLFVGVAALGAAVLRQGDPIFCANLILMSGWGAWASLKRGQGRRPGAVMTQVLGVSGFALSLVEAIRHHDWDKLRWVFGTIGVGAVLLLALLVLGRLFGKTQAKVDAEATR